jgi:hypothetical protein
MEVTTSSTFTLFPKLPVELRLQIWELALLGSRIIAIKSKFEDGSPTNPEALGMQPEYRVSSSPQPALLHTTSESRPVPLKHYEETLRDTLMNGPVYFDFKIDTLYLAGPGNNSSSSHEGNHFTESHIRLNNHQDSSQLRTKLRHVIIGGWPSFSVLLELC